MIMTFSNFAFLSPTRLDYSKSRSNAFKTSRINNLQASESGSNIPNLYTEAVNKGTQIAEGVVFETVYRLLEPHLGKGTAEAAASFASTTGVNAAADAIHNKMSGGSGDNVRMSVTSNLDGMIGDGTVLNYNSMPIETNLETGLKANVYSPFYENGTSAWTPLILSGQKIDFNASSSMNTYLTEVITREINNAVQGAVSFSVPSAILTSSNVTSYLTSVAQALQTYFYVDSVLTFTNNFNNRNPGMIYLAANMDGDTVNKLYNLKRTLMSTPIPPNLEVFVRWLMQTYCSSSLPGSSILKFVPYDIVSSTDAHTNALQSCITSLNSNSDVARLLARACPKWTGNPLASSNSVPLHDLDWLTLWTNSSQKVVTSSSTSISPASSSVSSDVVYNSFTNNLDGAITSCFYVNISSTNYPTGILAPVPQTMGYSTHFTNDNRMYFTSDGTLSPCASNRSFSHNSGFSHFLHYTDLTSSYIYSPFGTVPVNGVSGSSTINTCYRFYDWLVTTTSIGSLKDSREYTKSRDLYSGGIIPNSAGPSSSRGNNRKKKNRYYGNK